MSPKRVLLTCLTLAVCVWVVFVSFSLWQARNSLSSGLSESLSAWPTGTRPTPADRAAPKPVEVSQTEGPPQIVESAAAVSGESLNRRILGKSVTESLSDRDLAPFGQLPELPDQPRHCRKLSAVNLPALSEPELNRCRAYLALLRATNLGLTLAELSPLERFLIEERDASWAEFAEVQLLGLVSQIAGLPIVGLDASCRTTVCALTIQVTSLDAEAMNSVKERVRIHVQTLLEEFEFSNATAIANVMSSSSFRIYVTKSDSGSGESEAVD